MFIPLRVCSGRVRSGNADRGMRKKMFPKGPIGEADVGRLAALRANAERDGCCSGGWNMSQERKVGLRVSKWIAGMMVLPLVFGAPHAVAQGAGSGIGHQVPGTAEPRGQDGPWPRFERARVALLAGLIQPLLLDGGNVEIDVYYGRFVFGYSHGFLLDFEDSTVVGDAKDQGLAFHLPYSTGVSLGIRILEWLDVRLEGKVHRFEVLDAASQQELFAYTTFTVGAGMYAQYRPFYDFDVEFDEWLQGWMIMGSVRLWPNVASSLSGDERRYDNPTTGMEELHKAANIGIANTPLVINLAVGYSITF